MVDRKRLSDVLGERESEPSSSGSFSIVGEDGKPLPIKRRESEYGDFFTITIPRPSYLPEKKY